MSRKSGAHLSMRDYATVLSHLMHSPCSSVDMVDRMGLHLDTARKLLRRFRDQGLCHICEYRPTGPQSSLCAVYAAGRGIDVLPPALNSRGMPNRMLANRPSRVKPVALVTAFASVIHCLEQGMTKDEIAAETGIYSGVVRKLIEHMHTLSVIRIVEWQKPRTGYPAAVYILGRGRDAAYPKPPTRQEIEARRRASIKSKAMDMQIAHALAGTALVLQEAA